MKLKPEKNSGLNGIQTHDLCNTGAVLYQLSYQANWELSRGHGFKSHSSLRQIFKHLGNIPCKHCLFLLKLSQALLYHSLWIPSLLCFDLHCIVLLLQLALVHGIVPVRCFFIALVLHHEAGVAGEVLVLFHQGPNLHL